MRGIYPVILSGASLRVEGSVDAVVAEDFFYVFSGFGVGDGFYEHIGVVEVAETFQPFLQHMRSGVV